MLAASASAAPDAVPINVDDFHFSAYNSGGFGRFYSRYEIFPDGTALIVERRSGPDDAYVDYFHGKMSADDFAEVARRMTPFMVDKPKHDSCGGWIPDGPRTVFSWGGKLEHDDEVPHDCQDPARRKFFDDRADTFNWMIGKLVIDPCPFKTISGDGVSNDAVPVAKPPPLAACVAAKRAALKP